MKEEGDKPGQFPLGQTHQPRGACDENSAILDRVTLQRHGNA